MGKKVEVEWDDVQGIVLSGYGDLRRSAYLLWRFQSGDLPRNRKWLSDLLTRRLTPSQPQPGFTFGIDPAGNAPPKRVVKAANPPKNGICPPPVWKAPPSTKTVNSPRSRNPDFVTVGRSAAQRNTT